MWYFFVYNNFVYQSFLRIYLILYLAKHVFFLTVVRYISLNIAVVLARADYVFSLEKNIFLERDNR